MMVSIKTVDEYIAGLHGWQKEVVAQVRRLVLEAAPEASESIKWAQPVYEVNGPFAFIKAFKNHVNFGFWRGVDLPDALGLLKGTGEKMRHIKLMGTEDIHEGAFKKYVRSAVELNRSKGDPTKG